MAHTQTCDELMQKVNEATGLGLTQARGAVLGYKEWAIAYRNGEFSQKIDIQLASPEELQLLIMHTDGSGVRVNNANLVVEASSLHPLFSSAGSDALNYARGGGPPL